MDKMILTKKELIDFLNKRMDYFVNVEPNPFKEMQMVQYINNGLNLLNGMDIKDEEKVIMYDKDGHLEFKKEGE